MLFYQNAKSLVIYNAGINFSSSILNVVSKDGATYSEASIGKLETLKLAVRLGPINARIFFEIQEICCVARTQTQTHTRNANSRATKNT